LKNKKAAGIDGIQAELWKEAGEDNFKNRLFQIIRDIYATGEMPEDYIKSIITPSQRKQQQRNVRNSVPLASYHMHQKY